MSRSPEASASPLDDGRYRRMSVDSGHDRPEADEAPAKRMRTDAKVEDKARSKRLFGNLLGTLQKFKKEDNKARSSDSAKRREQVSERIASKIRSETNLHHEILEVEKELKTLRIGTDSAETVLKHKEAAMIARHTTLRPVSKFLHTSASTQPLIFETTLLAPSPIPLNRGPSRIPPPLEQAKPLYFLPKILLSHQDELLNRQISDIDQLIADESSALEKEKVDTAETVKRNRARIEELVAKLSELKKQVKPDSDIRPQAPTRDSFGRNARRDRQDEEQKGMDVDREAAVEIRGEDGDIEVEY
ncbi:hypothetical protein BCR39DRAFT_510904 [Naematelia encephala]|uniref:Pinin/SDK/MemA protein domain-containing protein n=1 Tax=Naematelia encephala TaxID=71784 RepID=A0A1Y2BLD8_9TREE|nr:hypothetical protein BCR39DRAFT_510904 [Naematelia encephala]